ncbi:LPXTG cell wall anchor domain-containing protein [Pseudogracilibacillus auburnensis]
MVEPDKPEAEIKIEPKTPEKPVEPQEPEDSKEPKETEKAPEKSNDNVGKKLPKTATNIFNVALVGLGLITLGFFFYKRRKRVVE